MKYEAIYDSPLDGGFRVHIFHRLVDPFVRPARFHCHPEYELGAVRSGRGTYLAGGESYNIEPGDVFAFSANEAHYITSIAPGEPLHLVNLHFTRGFICAPGSELGSTYLAPFASGQRRFAGAAESFCAAESALLREDAYSLREARAHVLLFLTALAKSAGRVDAADSAPAGATRAGEKLAGATGYIDAHLTERLTLDDIAAAAGMSRSYVSSEFGRRLGVPLWDYITAKRVQLAIELMHGTDMSMLDIALASGFNNSANFNRAFRRFTAKSPTEYLRESPQG